MFATLNRAVGALEVTAAQRALIPQIIRGAVEERPELSGASAV